jgi:hypothetical protein
VPPSSVLLSGPGCCSPGRRLPAKASSRHQWSGVVAVVGTAGTPAMASVSGPRPACSVHPSRFVVGIRRSSRPVSSPSGVQPVRCPARPVSSPSGVQPVRCPVTWVRRPGSSGPTVRCPAVRCPTVWCPAVWRPPVQRPDGWCPPRRSGRVRLVLHQTVALGQVAAAASVTTGTGRAPVGCRAVGRLGRRPRGRGRGRRWRVVRWSVGVGGGSGPGRVVGVGGGGRA